MSTNSVIKSLLQTGDKSQSAMNKMFDNANSIAAKQNTVNNVK